MLMTYHATVHNYQALFTTSGQWVSCMTSCCHLLEKVLELPLLLRCLDQLLLRHTLLELSRQRLQQEFNLALQLCRHPALLLMQY